MTTFRKGIMALGLTVALVACAPAVSGPRTQPENRNRGKLEIRIENRNWSAARVYVATSGSRPQRIATVHTNRVVSKFVRMYSPTFVLMVGLLASNETWVGFTTWSSEEECLHIRVSNVLYLTNVVPCRSRRKS